MNLKKKLLVLMPAMALCLLTHAAEAAGTRKFCLDWKYSFTDQSVGGEDYLLHSSGTIFGTVNASYAWTEIYLDAQLIWSGLLDQDGCTPSTVSGAAGTVSVWLFTWGKVQASNVRYYVTNNDSVWETYGYNWQASSSAVPNGVIGVYDLALGGGASAADAAAVWSWLLRLNDGRTMANKKYTVVIEENCPDVDGSACYYPLVDAVYLGSDDQGNKAKRKFLVAHEIGHNLQRWLFGFQNHLYNQDGPAVSGPDYCRCEHIPDENLRQHCIQSRESSGAAQVEGFGHFNGADAFNNPAGSYAGFTYYKHALIPPNDTATPPPNSWWAYSPIGVPYRWKDTNCPASGTTGTELDWMSFYYLVHNKVQHPFSFTDLRSVYLNACGDAPCEENADTVDWLGTVNGVTLAFGGGSDEVADWIEEGANAGVD